MRFEPDPLWKRLEKYPKWIRDYVHHVQTFFGAEEVEEIFFLRGQNKALIKLVGELKAENRRLRKNWPSLSEIPKHNRIPTGIAQDSGHTSPKLSSVSHR